MHFSSLFFVSCCHLFDWPLPIVITFRPSIPFAFVSLIIKTFAHTRARTHCDGKCCCNWMSFVALTSLTFCYKIVRCQERKYLTCFVFIKRILRHWFRAQYALASCNFIRIKSNEIHSMSKQHTHTQAHLVVMTCENCSFSLFPSTYFSSLVQCVNQLIMYVKRIHYPLFAPKLWLLRSKHPLWYTYRYTETSIWIYVSWRIRSSSSIH